MQVPAPHANRALALTSLAVLLASSTWFSGTAATPALISAWNLSEAGAAWLTISVQLGFIAGTLLYAALNLADLFNARRVFLISAWLGAACNAGFALLSDGLTLALAFRFLTGVTLAGVYPVGMKIVASWFRDGLGWRLGVMVGALTLGTAAPYLFQALGAGLPWQGLVLTGSVGAALGGGLIVAAVGDGPYLRGRAKLDLRVMVAVFRHAPFRYTALGYFGHMWELYAFWSMIALYLGASFAERPGLDAWVPLWAFAAIGVGVGGCVLGGWMSRTWGERPVALAALLASASLCVLSGWAFDWPPALLVPLVLLWGVFVIADSPQFSALAARHAPPGYTGTALTIQNGIGFAVTAVSIQLLPWIAQAVGWQWALVFLAPGPLLGALALRALGRLQSETIVGHLTAHDTPGR